jgi:hypothetical protein
MDQPMTRRALGGLALGAAAVTLAGFGTLASGSSRRPSALTLGASRTTPHAWRAPSSPTARRTYPGEGVVLIRPRKSFVTPVSAREAIGSFERQDFSRGVVANWDVAKLRAGEYVVTERFPVYPGQHPAIRYPAWVVTLHRAPSFDFGGAVGHKSPARTFRCENVAILDVRISKWTDFFQTCR